MYIFNAAEIGWVCGWGSWLGILMFSGSFFFFRGMCYTGALSLGHDLLLAGRSDVRSVFSIDLAI